MMLRFTHMQSVAELVSTCYVFDTIICIGLDWLTSRTNTSLWRALRSPLWLWLWERESVRVSHHIMDERTAFRTQTEVNRALRGSTERERRGWGQRRQRGDRKCICGQKIVVWFRSGSGFTCCRGCTQCTDEHELSTDRAQAQHCSVHYQCLDVEWDPRDSWASRQPESRCHTKRTKRERDVKQSKPKSESNKCMTNSRISWRQMRAEIKLFGNSNQRVVECTVSETYLCLEKGLDIIGRSEGVITF